jgi:hypothetical protein
MTQVLSLCFPSTFPKPPHIARWLFLDADLSTIRLMVEAFAVLKSDARKATAKGMGEIIHPLRTDLPALVRGAVVSQKLFFQKIQDIKKPLPADPSKPQPSPDAAASPASNSNNGASAKVQVLATGHVVLELVLWNTWNVPREELAHPLVPPLLDLSAPLIQHGT